MADPENKYSGKRVKIFHPSFGWGTICQKGLSDYSVTVVCRQFGFDDGVMYVGVPDGKESGPIFLSDVRCIGNELYIWDCIHNGWNFHDCSHSNDLVVGCVYND